MSCIPDAVGKCPIEYALNYVVGAALVVVVLLAFLIVTLAVHDTIGRLLRRDGDDT